MKTSFVDYLTGDLPLLRAHSPGRAAALHDGRPQPGTQFKRHLKFKAWVKAWIKDEVEDAFRKAPDRKTVKAWVKAVQNVY